MKTVLALGLAATASSFAPRRSVQMHYVRRAAIVGVLAGKGVMAVKSKEVFAPRFGHLYGYEQGGHALALRSKIGPEEILTSSGTKRILEQLPGTRQDKIEWCLKYGVMLLPLLASQTPWKIDHYWNIIAGFRAFSLGCTQLGKRLALFMFIRENDVVGKTSVHDLTNTKGVEIAKKLEIAMIAMGAIGDPSRPNIPAWYVKGPLASAADVQPLHIVALCMNLAMADEKARKKAEKKSRKMGYGLLICASCLYGAFWMALALAGMISWSMIGSTERRREYHARDGWYWRDVPVLYSNVARPVQGQFHSDVKIYVGAMTCLMKLWMEGGWNMAVRLMDNSTRRTLTPYLVIGVCSNLHLLNISGGMGALGCSIAAFPEVYNSNEFVLCCLLHMMYCNGGIFDFDFLDQLVVPTGARGRFGWAVESICVFFGKRDKKPIEADEADLGDFSDEDEFDEGMDLDDVKPDPDDDDDEKPPPWWLSLLMGIAALFAAWRLAPLVDDGLLDAIGAVPGLEVYQEYYGGQLYQIIVARPYRGVQHLADAWGARPTMADLLSADTRKAVKMSDLRAQLPRLQTADDYAAFAARVRAEGNATPCTRVEEWRV